MAAQDMKRSKRVSLAAAIALGAWFLATGIAKTLDPVGFAAVIEEYGVITGAGPTRLLAWAIIAAEVAAGAALLFGVARRAALALAAAMLLVFTAATAREWAAGRVHDCGCFGPLLERTPGQTLVQDLILLGIVGVALLAPAGSPAPRGSWRRRAALGAALAGVAAPPVVARFAPPLAEGETLAALRIEAHLPWEPPAEALFAFVDPLAPGAPARALDALAGSGARVVALSSAGPEEIERFRWTAGPAFEIVSVPRRLVRRLSDDRPGAFRVVDGRVARVWRGRLPALEEIVAKALGRPAGGAEPAQEAGE